VHVTNNANVGALLPVAAAPSLYRALLRDFLTTQGFVMPFMGLSVTPKLVQAVALGSLLQTFNNT
jgi:hypothetical protein